MTLTLVLPWPHLLPWPQTSQTKLNWCPSNKISIFHEMTLTLILKFDLYVTPYQKWSFYVNSFKSYSLNRHTDRYTDTMKTLPLLHTQEVTKQWMDYKDAGIKFDSPSPIIVGLPWEERNPDTGHITYCCVLHVPMHHSPECVRHKTQNVHTMYKI